MGRRRNGDEDDRDTPEEEPKYQGKTYQEWRDDVLAASGINPLDFLVGDGTKEAIESRMHEVIAKNNGAVMALMYVDLLFQRGQSLHHLYRVNTVAYTERSKVSMQKTKDGRLVGMSAAGAPGMLEKFLRGEVRLAPDAVNPGGAGAPLPKRIGI